MFLGRGMHSQPLMLITASSFATEWAVGWWGGAGGGYIRKAVASSAICEAPCASAVPEEIDRISEYVRLHRRLNALIIFLLLLC